MARPSFAAVKAALSETKPREQSTFQNNYYPFWNMKTGERCVVRFVPDLNEDNPRGFLVEKLSHSLTINGERKTIVCPKQENELADCPICALSQKYYKAKDQTNGKKYWKSKQSIAQCIVVEDPLPPNDQGESHVGKLRLISLGYQLNKVISDAYADELEDHPYLFDNGVDFIIKKTDQGGNAQYIVGCKFSNRPRHLTDEEMREYEEKAVDLASVLPKPLAIEKIQALLDAELSGESLDEDFETPEPEARKAPSRTQSAPVSDDEDEDDDVPQKPAKPAKPADSDGGSEDIEDMLAVIKRRRQKA